MSDNDYENNFNEDEVLNSNDDNVFKYIPIIIVAFFIAVFTGINIDRAIKRLKFTHAEKLKDYRERLNETTLKLLDESLSDIERQRYEKSRKNYEKKIRGLEKKAT